MTVSATDNAVNVIVSENGMPGAPGAPGANGSGFNSVRKSLLDSPLINLYEKNRLVETLRNTLEVTRAVGGSYTNIYGVSTSADPDEPREEAEGWLITDDETHTFQSFSNFPLADNGFSVVIELGSYSAGSVSQNIISVPATSGNLFTFGASATNKWRASLQGSGAVTYDANGTVAVGASTAIAVYYGGTLSVYVDGTLDAITTLPTGLTADIDVDGIITINGDFTLNLLGLRIYDFALNDSEITYLS